MYSSLALFCTFAFLYSLVARRVEKLPISGPMIFLGAGLLLGPYGLAVFTDQLGNNQVRMIADLTLAIFLFVDAAKTRIKILDANYQLPLRLLLLGLPATILLGVLVGYCLFDQLGFYEVCLIAVMLAATDAALGKAVVSNPELPEHLSMSLNVESGLNDGLCVPLLLLFIALASIGYSAEVTNVSAIELFIHELGIGFLVGAIVSALGSWLLHIANAKGWISGHWLMVPSIMLALSCFAIAQELGGSGYIAAFVGGLFFRNGTDSFRKVLLDEAEGIGEILAMATWLILGLFVIGGTLANFSWSVLLYALLSLSVVRILPVYLALTGTKELPVSRLFIGWFGPRGLASIVFAVIVVESKIPNAQFIMAVVVTTVFLSAVLHGLTAAPATKALALRLNSKS